MDSCCVEYVELWRRTFLGRMKHGKDGPEHVYHSKVLSFRLRSWHDIFYPEFLA